MRVVVVGAGSAGLSVAAALRRRGVPAVVLEQGPAVGAAWRGRYAELRLNTLRRLSDLPGVPIPSRAGRWVTRDDYVAHLEAFAARHEVVVRCAVRVRRIDRAPGGWTVRTDDDDHEAAAVVVATGRAHVPVVPPWPGRSTFARPLLHGADVTRVSEFAGRRVLVVGGGNSGVDLACQLVAAGAASVQLSVRTPPTILPLQMVGVPVQPLGIALRRLPDRTKDAIARAMSRAALGDLTPFGLPRPRVGPYTRLRTSGVTAAVDRGFAGLVRAGRVRIVADVACLDADDVVLADGARVRPDVVVATTGFRPGLEELVGHLGVLTPSGLPATSPGRPAPGAPGLWFAGFWPAIEGDLYRHPSEARRIARGIARQARRDAEPPRTTALAREPLGGARRRP
jgi:cation diffusion facilitator CzcD-associated flavoprotein CzcO